VIEPYCPKTGNSRQPVGLSILLRVYFWQQWFNLSDPGAEDALYEPPILRRFAGVDLDRAVAPDETMILRFWRLLETHELCGQILDMVNHCLAGKGLRISTGTIMTSWCFSIRPSMGPETCCTKHASADYKAISSRGFVHSNLPPTLIPRRESDKTVSATMIANFAAS
jgi:IS5 family transposase